MISPSRLITGSLILVISLWFVIFLGIADGPGIDFGAIITGVIFLIVGLFILLNENEDEIEQIKSGGKK